ncbi:MAG: glycosyltransferase, partial [Patulibacter sp.]|nr:glycosyltransferase [Patulibacter sp.]
PWIAVKPLPFRVTVVAPVSAAQHRDFDPVRALADEGIRLVPTPREESREREALRAFSRDPRLLARAAAIPFYGLQTEMLAGGMRAAIAREAAAGVDVVTVEHDIGAALIDGVPAALPRALTLENITPAYYRTRAAEATGAKRAAYRWQARTTARYLRDRLPRFDALIAVSPDDAALLDASRLPPIHVVANGTDVAEPLLPPVDGAAPRLLFTGTMSHPPNRDGILWFAREVWPGLAAAHPELRLDVVGRAPVPAVVALGETDDRIEVTGGVPSMVPYYERATITIAPIFSGGGTRLKVLDALAAGRPLVTSTIGCEGIAVTDGQDVLVADEPAAFAASITRLLDAPGDRAALARAGRQLVEERYDWNTLGAHLGDVLADVVARRGAAASV